MKCKIVRHLGPGPEIRPKLPIKVFASSKRIGNASLITGASSGLGRELSILFSNQGHVILSGRNSSELEKTKQQCKDPANTTLVCGDLRHIGTQNQLASFANLYSIRYLICCAGAYERGKISMRALAAPPITDIFHINATATIELVHRIWPVLTRTRGTLIHINSMAGKNISPDEAVYSASKHAMTGFLKSLRFEGRITGIRVMDIFAGAIQTPMSAGRSGYEKMMSPAEVARAVYTAATMDLKTAQVEELHLGRSIG